MLAKAYGRHTRAELGMRRPRSVSRNITPERGGVVPHWGGNKPTIRTHADCIKTWLGWQRYHMDFHGWVDLAYNGGYCQHGIIFPGRGAGVRSAANGTNEGNQNHYAVVWIGGKGMIPTLKALRALLWWIMVLRSSKVKPAGKKVWPHRKFTGSECPGDELIDVADRYDGKRVSDVPPTVRPGDDNKTVVRLKRRMRAHGYKVKSTSTKYGKTLKRQVEILKIKHGLKRNSVVGRKVWKILLRDK